MYQLELVWNREFDFVPYGSPKADLDVAIKFAREMENSGDGARVKETRILNSDGEVVWQYGRKVQPPEKGGSDGEVKTRPRSDR